MKLTPYEQDYCFDLQGYLRLPEALSAAQLRAVNDWIDAQDELPFGAWIGQVETHTYSGNEGINYQNIIEGGAVFEELIDNPAWLEPIRRWMVNDYSKVCINEAFVNVRRSGGFIGLHSGGHVSAPIMSLRNERTGAWNVGQVNVLVALRDIGPGDGATVIVPGSHKSAIQHPELVDSPSGSSTYRSDRHAGDVLGGMEVHLRAGEAVMFTDSISHGACARVNQGERRVLIYRYSPHAIATRYNYIPSPALLARLTPERRAIVQPVPPRLAPGQVLVGDEAAVSH